MPKERLTLVGNLIKEIYQLENDELDELLYLFEVGSAQIFNELKIRDKEKNARRQNLILVQPRPEIEDLD